MAFRAIRRATGWRPRQPVSGQRCLTRKAFDAARPLAAGWGVETGMTIDLLVAGFTLQEVVCEIKHRASGNNWAGQRHRADQYRGVFMAVNARRFRRVRVPKAKRRQTSVDFEPYNAFGG